MPKLIKNILVPTDFSQHSDHALAAAIKMAKKISGQIYLYHRIHLHPNWHVFTQEEKDCHPNIQKREASMNENFQKCLNAHTHSGIRINAVYSSGDLFERTDQLIQHFDIDMIVMGSEGADGLKELLYGSYAEKISHRVDVPVLTIKHPVDEFGLKDVVFASDFEEDALEPFEKLVDLMRNFGSTIHLLYIASIKEFVVSEEVINRMREFEKRCWALPTVVHGQADQSIEMGVQHYMVNSRADLLCTVHHEKGPFQKIINPSISAKLIRHLECPVLSLPAQKKKHMLKS